MKIDNFYLVFSGSGNLRSSRSIEQFVLQENEELFLWYKELFNQNRSKSIINKEVSK